VRIECQRPTDYGAYELIHFSYSEWVNGRGEALEVYNPATEECKSDVLNILLAQKLTDYML